MQPTLKIEDLNIAQAFKVLESILGLEKFKNFTEIAKGVPEPDRLNWLRNLLHSMHTGSTKPLNIYTARTFKPVDVVTVVEHKEYLDSKNVLYPKVLDCLVEMNNGNYQEAVLTGAIGTGKSTLALYTTAYQLYLLASYSNPHGEFGLDPSSEILFIFQSINASLAQAVEYQRFKTMILKSRFFRESFCFDTKILSELRFPNRIIVKPLSGLETGAIGQNVIGGIMDEMNFMAIVEQSKNSMDSTVYDQANALYDSIAMRRKSRFMQQGVVPGMLCLVSSKRYPGQFTDRKEAEAYEEVKRTGKTSIYIYDKREWDVKPIERFSGNWFNIFIGDEARRPRILEDVEIVSDQDRPMVMAIPLEYRQNFEADIMKALRDVAGVSTLAHHPFIQERDSVAACQRKDHIIFGKEMVDFKDHKLLVYANQFKDPHFPRFVHCDLAITGDSAGLAIGCVTHFVPAKGGGWMPHIWIDGLLEIKPPKGGEILLYKVREVITVLNTLGLNIKWVTFDQFQSTDSMQLLRQSGFAVGLQSMDVTTYPYDFTKNALYDRRISMPTHKKVALELVSLEKDVKKNKIDHPPRGSKDVSDALAGVVYGLTMRRESWLDHDIPLGEIPLEVLNSLKNGKDKLKVEEQPLTNNMHFNT